MHLFANPVTYIYSYICIYTYVLHACPTHVTNSITCFIIHTPLRCLKELLDYNAEINKADEDGNNILHIACIHGQLHIVQFLLQHGLSVELRWLCVSTLKKLHYIICVYYSNGYLGTALSCAAHHGHNHIVKFLLSRDVSCDGSYAELKVMSISPLHKHRHKISHS